MNKNLKKLLSVAISAGVLFTAFSQPVFAYSVAETVSVGLESVCKNVSRTSLGGSKLLIGEERNGHFVKADTLSASNGFMVTLKTGNYIALDEAMEKEEALDLANRLQRLDLEANAAYIGNETWTVYVANASLSEVEEETEMDGKKIQDFSGVLIEGRESVLIPQDGTIYFMGTEKGDTFSVGNRLYRGMLSFAVNGTVMTAVNTLGLEEYLYGVVPSEMPASYEKEALKAQAVAARSYAATKLGAHKSSGYELCDTTNCQVYKGYSGEAVNTTIAIDETAGQVVCYNGKPIEAVFSASSGGYTENSENAWGSAVPYLRAVPEVAEYGDNTWKIQISLYDLEKLLGAKNENIGGVEDIVITKISTGGRVQEMKIIGDRGEVSLTKETIRTYFSSTPAGSLPGRVFTINGKGGEIGAYGGVYETAAPVSNKQTKGGSLAAAAASDGIVAKTEGDLASINGQSLAVNGVKNGSNTNQKNIPADGAYETYTVNISTGNGSDTFVFEGIGKGHGVGMSQKGAQSLAQMGKDYEEILQYYYTGITLEG